MCLFRANRFRIARGLELENLSCYSSFSILVFGILVKSPTKRVEPVCHSAIFFFILLSISVSVTSSIHSIKEWLVCEGGVLREFNRGGGGVAMMLENSVKLNGSRTES